LRQLWEVVCLTGLFGDNSVNKERIPFITHQLIKHFLEDLPEKLMKIAVHITHEAMKKVGGVGAVLNGICSFIKSILPRVFMLSRIFKKFSWHWTLFGHQSSHPKIKSNIIFTDFKTIICKYIVV